jgi:hypothetical protein
MTPSDEAPDPTPRTPPAPPPVSNQPQATDKGDYPELDAYHTASETVGFLPTIRIADNLIQAAAVALFTVIGAVVGYIIGMGIEEPPPWACGLIGAVSGMVLATLITGFVLMVLGWVRAITRATRK